MFLYNGLEIVNTYKYQRSKRKARRISKIRCSLLSAVYKKKKKKDHRKASAYNCRLKEPSSQMCAFRLSSPLESNLKFYEGSTMHRECLKRWWDFLCLYVFSLVPSFCGTVTSQHLGFWFVLILPFIFAWERSSCTFGTWIVSSFPSPLKQITYESILIRVLWSERLMHL